MDDCLLTSDLFGIELCHPMKKQTLNFTKNAKLMLPDAVEVIHHFMQQKEGELPESQSATKYDRWQAAMKNAFGNGPIRGHGSASLFVDGSFLSDSKSSAQSPESWARLAKSPEPTVFKSDPLYIFPNAMWSELLETIPKGNTEAAKTLISLLTTGLLRAFDLDDKIVPDGAFAAAEYDKQNFIENGRIVIRNRVVTHEGLRVRYGDLLKCLERHVGIIPKNPRGPGAPKLDSDQAMRLLHELWEEDPRIRGLKNRRIYREIIKRYKPPPGKDKPQPNSLAKYLAPEIRRLKTLYKSNS